MGAKCFTGSSWIDFCATRLPALRLRWMIAGLLCNALVLANSAATAAVSEWVDLDIGSGNLRIPSSISGIPGFSIIDTGASTNAINSVFLRKHNLKFTRTARSVRVEGVFGKTQQSIYAVIPVTLFGTELKFKRLVDLNLGKEDKQLIIGAGFLNNYIVQFDYPKKRFRLMSRDTLNLKKLKNVTSRKDKQTGAPIVKTSLNDEEELWLMLDTGNSGGVLMPRKYAARNDWLERFGHVSNQARGVVRSGNIDTFNLPKLTIGNIEVENPIISVPADGEKAQIFKAHAPRVGSNIKIQRKAQGILGFDVLQHFVVTVDYKSGAVHMGLPRPESK